jgi:hypothetical protein
MTDARINIIADDNQVDALVQSMNNLQESMQGVIQVMQNTQRQASQTEQGLEGLENETRNVDSSLKSMARGALAGVAAFVSLETAQAALQFGIEQTKRAFEALAATNRQFAAETQTVRSQIDQAYASFGRYLFQIVGGDQAISDLNFVLQETAIAFNNLSDETGEGESAVLAFAQSALVSASAANEFLTLIEKIVISLQTAAATAELAAIALAVPFSPAGPTAGLRLLSDATEEFNRKINDLADDSIALERRNEGLARTFDLLQERFEQGPDATLTYANSINFLAERFGVLGRLMAGVSGLSDEVFRTRGGGSFRAPEPEPEPGIPAETIEDVRESIFESYDRFLDIVSQSKIRGEEATRVLGMSVSSIMREYQMLLGDGLQELLDGFFEQTGDVNYARFEERIVSNLGDLERNVQNALLQAEEEARIEFIRRRKTPASEEFNFVQRNVDLLKEYGRVLNEASETWNGILELAETGGASEERINSIVAARERQYAEINERFTEQIRLADLAREALKAPEPVTIDTSPLTSGFAMRTDMDNRAELIALATREFATMEEAIKAVTDALSDQERKWLSLNNIGIGEYIKLVEDSKERTREAFKTDAIDGFTSSIEDIGSFLGQTLAQSFDDGLTGAERAKALLAGMLGDFLTTIGSTAIAQGAIVAFGDPAAGGLPNPGRAAGLIAAGTAAVIAGSALSGVASNIQRSGQGTPGAGAGATPGATSSAQSTTNVFIENRFGNRFDARELDRSANETFSRAAQAGQ